MAQQQCIEYVTIQSGNHILPKNLLRVFKSQKAIDHRRLRILKVKSKNLKSTGYY